MATAEKSPDTLQQADSKEMMRLVSQGRRVTDPELRRRVRERADKVRQEIFENFGVVDWAVDMIRDTRENPREE